MPNKCGVEQRDIVRKPVVMMPFAVAGTNDTLSWAYNSGQYAVTETRLLACCFREGTFFILKKLGVDNAFKIIGNQGHVNVHETDVSLPEIFQTKT